MARFPGFIANLILGLRHDADDEKPAAEILPPDRQAAPNWDLNMSVEERAEAFAALFLDAAPRDRRGRLKEH